MATTNPPDINIDEDEIIIDTDPYIEDDEEAWLDALEKGDLDDYGELKKDKDPGLMTARQRALKERTSALSSKSFANATLLGRGTAKARVMTEEAQKLKEEKNKRRKLQAVKRAEESQKQTIERLIKQQSGRITKDRQKKTNINSDFSAAPPQQKSQARVVSKIKCVSKGTTISLSFSEGSTNPFLLKSAQLTNIRPQRCICGKPRKYACSKTKVSLCSLQCYRENKAQKVT
uniref:INO80 complex subunit B-like n=1 Tax=Styela clava TaxID=7725 RepID=UPI0019393F2A|nr:INO80 complex subunit B-like [Styela clava]